MERRKKENLHIYWLVTIQRKISYTAIVERLKK